MISHIQGEQANYYTTDEPMICHAQGEHLECGRSWVHQWCNS
jgi:hypothetical protein